VVAQVVEHFVVHRGIVLPEVKATGTVPAWAWAALLAPELVACFAAGWGLRSWRPVVAYAALATSLRVGFYALLSATGEPGHGPLDGARGEITLTPPIVALAYLVIAGMGAYSRRQAEQLDGA
jgi:hypothetical protein